MTSVVPYLLIHPSLLKKLSPQKNCQTKLQIAPTLNHRNILPLFERSSYTNISGGVSRKKTESESVICVVPPISMQL
jgi:hypothetical protein